MWNEVIDLCDIQISFPLHTVRSSCHDLLHNKSWPGNHGQEMPEQLVCLFFATAIKFAATTPTFVTHIYVFPEESRFRDIDRYGDRLCPSPWFGQSLSVPCSASVEQVISITEFQKARIVPPGRPPELVPSKKNIPSYRRMPSLSAPQNVDLR